MDGSLTNIANMDVWINQTCLLRAELVSWIQRHLTTCPHLTRKNIVLTGMEEIWIKCGSLYYYRNISYCARFSLAVDQSQVMDVCDTLLEELHYRPTIFQRKFKILCSIDKKKLTKFLDLHIVLFVFKLCCIVFFIKEVKLKKCLAHNSKSRKLNKCHIFQRLFFLSKKLRKEFPLNFGWKVRLWRRCVSRGWRASTRQTQGRKPFLEILLLHLTIRWGPHWIKYLLLAQMMHVSRKFQGEGIIAQWFITGFIPKVQIWFINHVFAASSYAEKFITSSQPGGFLVLNKTMLNQFD